MDRETEKKSNLNLGDKTIQNQTPKSYNRVWNDQNSLPSGWQANKAVASFLPSPFQTLRIYAVKSHGLMESLAFFLSWSIVASLIHWNLLSFLIHCCLTDSLREGGWEFLPLQIIRKHAMDMRRRQQRNDQPGFLSPHTNRAGQFSMTDEHQSHGHYQNSVNQKLHLLSPKAGSFAHFPIPHPPGTTTLHFTNNFTSFP